MNRFLSSIVNWLRAGYPDGVPDNDYLPILALLSSRGLSAEEVAAVARELQHVAGADDIDIAAEILRVKDHLPAPADVDRVRAKLAANGWPLDDRDVS